MTSNSKELNMYMMQNRNGFFRGVLIFTVVLLCAVGNVQIAHAANSCKAKCFVTQIDTCAQHGGSPPACEACRGLFQPCWDQYCYFEDKACIDTPDGGSCTEVVTGAFKGLQRVCTSGEIDWVNCWGQPRCFSEYVTNYDNTPRHSC